MRLTLPETIRRTSYHQNTGVANKETDNSDIHNYKKTHGEPLVQIENQNDLPV